MLHTLIRPMLLILLVPVYAWSSVESVYPANPSVQSDSVFVTGQGVARYHRITGERIWLALPEVQLDKPLVIGPRVIVGGSQRLFALDGGSGRLLWQHRFREKIFNPVLVRDQLVVTSSKGKVYAFSAEAGDLLWKSKIAQGWLYPPAVAGDLLITGGQNSMIFALDATTGAERWQQRVDQELVYSPMATGSGGILVTTFGGDVIMLKSDDGSTLWRIRFSTPPLFPSIVDDHLLTSEMDGTLHALDPDSGKTIWRQSLPSRLVAPVSGSGGLLIAVVDGGEVLLLDSSSGSILKSYRLGSEAIGSALFSGKSIVVFTRDRNNPSPVPVYIEVF